MCDKVCLKLKKALLLFTAPTEVIPQCCAFSRVLVLDRGEMIEFDSPSNLIAQRGAFYKMAKDVGLA